MSCRKSWKTKWVFCVATLLVAPMLGCHKGAVVAKGRDFKDVAQPWNEVESAMPTPVPATPPYAHMQSYPLRVGDEITFTLTPDTRTTQGVYRLRVNDQLSVEYMHDRAADRRDRTMQVLPNGTVDLPLIGPVRVAGYTVEEATHQANMLAKRYYKFPQIVMTVSDVSERSEDLRLAIAGGTNKESLTVRVSPDGTIDLPEIGTVHIFGRTLPSVREEVQKLYDRAAPGVRVWPQLTERAPDQVFVLGQVKSPGRYMLNRPTHASQAIALAGGWLRGAELGEVVLIRFREGSPQAAPLNLKAALQPESCPHAIDLTDDLLIADGDILVVPRNKAQTMDDHIRHVFCEGIYGVLPFPAMHEKNSSDHDSK